MNSKKGAFNVFGFPVIQQRLRTYLESGRVHPSILLVGPEDEARFRIAKAAAKWILSLEKGLDPNHIENSTAKRIDKEIHPDVFLFSEIEDSTIKIETVRQLCQQMEYAAVEGGAKVCVIDRCDRLTEAAANALLKSLEEPGNSRYFILLTSRPGSLLPTILSRCIQFALDPTQDNELYEKELEQFRSGLDRFWETGNTLTLREITKDKEMCGRFVGYLQRSLHEVVCQPQQTKHQFLKQRSMDENLSCFEACLQTESQLRSNANYGLMLENLLIQNFTKPL